MKLNLEELPISRKINISESLFSDIVGDFLKNILFIDFFFDFWCNICIDYILAFDFSIFILDEKLVAYLYQIPLLFLFVLDNIRNHQFIDIWDIG